MQLSKLHVQNTIVLFNCNALYDDLIYSTLINK